MKRKRSDIHTPAPLSETDTEISCGRNRLIASCAFVATDSKWRQVRTTRENPSTCHEGALDLNPLLKCLRLGQKKSMVRFEPQGSTACDENVQQGWVVKRPSRKGLEKIEENRETPRGDSLWERPTIGRTRENFTNPQKCRHTSGVDACHPYSARKRGWEDGVASKMRLLDVRPRGSTRR